MIHATREIKYYIVGRSQPSYGLDLVETLACEIWIDTVMLLESPEQLGHVLKTSRVVR
jgi:hypothetical protein